MSYEKASNKTPVSNKCRRREITDRNEENIIGEIIVELSINECHAVNDAGGANIADVERIHTLDSRILGHQKVDRGADQGPKVDRGADQGPL